jgi:hypothetical protein
MSNRNPEVQINALIRVIGDDLPTQLTALQTAYADGIALDNIKKFYEAAQTRPYNRPACVIEALRSVPKENAEGIRRHFIRLRLFVESLKGMKTYLGRSLTSSELATKKLQRTLEGIEIVLENNYQLIVDSVPQASQVLVRDVPYDPVKMPKGPEGQQELFFKDGTLLLEVLVSS